MKMEVKNRYVLRHESGLFLSWSPDSMPHTKKLSQARRFYSVEEISNFLENSFYKPDRPEEYEIVNLKITYELEEIENVDPQSGTKESETSLRY